MNDQQLANLKQSILDTGPARVLINEHEAVPAPTAYMQYGISPTHIFIRDDGWSLGAPEHLVGAARRLWSKNWILEFSIKKESNDSA